MKKNLVLMTVPFLLAGVVGIGLALLLAVAAPTLEQESASAGVLPTWFTGALALHTSGPVKPEGLAAPAPARPLAGDPETYTDETGHYHFEALPHGTHKVTLDLMTLPPDLRPAVGEAAPVLWLTPGMEQTSAPLSTGVRFTAAYDRASGDISGLVFLDRDGDGQHDPGEHGLSGVRVVDPTVHQYFVPFDDHDLWDLFEGKAACHRRSGVNTDTACLPLQSAIHLTAGSDDTVYYYDHWEDGYDDNYADDPLEPGSTTEVGMLNAGETRVFQSDIYTVGKQTKPYYYDGRDRITIVGEKANVVRQANPGRYVRNGNCPSPPSPDPTSGGWLAAAWEVAEAADWGTQYVATVGEDLNYGTTITHTPDDHDFAGLEVMAWQDGTDVYYNGAHVITLNEGQAYFVDGANDGPGCGGVDSADTIFATKPVQVQMMTGACSGSYVSARGYTLQPVDVWDNAYWPPVPGFTQACNPDGDEVDTDIYLHNPHNYPITVHVSSGAQVAALVIPTRTTSSTLRATGWSDLASITRATYLSSTQTFWGVAAIDSTTGNGRGSLNWDWGYSLIPEFGLSSQVVVGYAPGNPPPETTYDPSDNPNGNLAFVTAITDTTIYVDLNQDGLPDPFDVNGDGDRDDRDVYGMPGWDEPLSALGIPIAAGQSFRVADPNDYNLIGALIYTERADEKIAVAWGQDPCVAGKWNFIDLGYTILPFPSTSLSKRDALALDMHQTGDFSPGDVVTYTMLLHNNSMGAMYNVVLTDPLPYTHTHFVPGSLQVSTPPAYSVGYYDGTAWSTTPTSATQMFTITWDTIGPRQEVTITLLITLSEDIPPTIHEVTNQAMVDSDLTDPRLSEDPDDPPDPDTDTPVYQPVLSIEKSVSRHIISPDGDRFRYTILVENADAGNATHMTISDTLPAWLQYISGTLDITWPYSYTTRIATRNVTQTARLAGYYADDFDLDSTRSTTYTGSDGTLHWTSDWTEFDDDGDPATGDVQVVTTTGYALSDLACLMITDTAGVTRTANISGFVDPILRYYVSGTVGNTGVYSVAVNNVISSETYAGGYTLRELDLSSVSNPATVTLFFTGTAGNDYWFDHIAIYGGGQVTRVVTSTLKSEEQGVLSYTTSTGGDPITVTTKGISFTTQIVITEDMTLYSGGYIIASFEVTSAKELTRGMELVNTGYISAVTWMDVSMPLTDTATVVVQPLPVGGVILPDSPLQAATLQLSLAALIGLILVSAVVVRWKRTH